MGAPHITGIVGLIRSTDPLLTTAQVKSKLQAAAGGSFQNSIVGYGLPNAATAVNNSIPTQRLTPLFAMWEYQSDDYVYTVFPQTGGAFNSGTVPPARVGTIYSTGPYLFYTALGNTVAQFPNYFLGQARTSFERPIGPNNYVPRARLKVFTTQRDQNGTALWPICRFSRATTTAVRHIMDTAASCQQSSVPSFFMLDGIEGYVYPPNSAQPSGTVAVIRMEKLPPPGGTYTWILGAQSDQTSFQSLGFVNPVVLGYAYLN